MLAALLPLVCLAVAPDDDPGFGGAAGDEVVAPDDDAPATLPAGSAADVAALPTWTGAPTPVEGAEPTTTPTKLERELELARLDPARFPLLRLRVDVARGEDELARAEARGLVTARDAEERLAAARALLLDVERIALHRMNRCAVRAGQPSTTVKSWRMTPGGPIALSAAELLAQANVLDPPGCARIELIDEAVVARVRRARTLKVELRTREFPFHRLDERRALEDELKGLLKQLADDGLPKVLAPGDRGWSR